MDLLHDLDQPCPFGRSSCVYGVGHAAAGVATELGGASAAGSNHLPDLGLCFRDRRYHLRTAVPLADFGWMRVVMVARCLRFSTAVLVWAAICTSEVWACPMCK